MLDRMSLLTDKDITKLRERDIVIEPYLEDGLTPAGYDFHVGSFVYSLESGLLEPKDGCYELQPENTILILTKESLWVSKRLGGSFHSKVSLVSQGLSSISTTLDPNWFGPLLIAIRNNNKIVFPMKEGQAFVTLQLFKVSTPTTTKPGKPSHRLDIIKSLLTKQLPKAAEEQFENNTSAQIKKFIGIIEQQEAQERFSTLVRDATVHEFRNRIVKLALMSELRRKVNRNLDLIIGFALIAFLATLQYYWNNISVLFNNVPYDSGVTNIQITGIIAVLLFLLGRKSK
jgi:deoxycytidine triphosphate deaminase